MRTIPDIIRTHSSLQACAVALLVAREGDSQSLNVKEIRMRRGRLNSIMLVVALTICALPAFAQTAAAQ